MALAACLFHRMSTSVERKQENITFTTWRIIFCLLLRHWNKLHLAIFPMCKVTLKINIIYLVLLANWGCNFKNICQYVLGFFTAIVFVRLFQVKKKKVFLNTIILKIFMIKNKSQLFIWKQDLDLAAFHLPCHFSPS